MPPSPPSSQPLPIQATLLNLSGCTSAKIPTRPFRTRTLSFSLGIWIKPFSVLGSRRPIYICSEWSRNAQFLLVLRNHRASSMFQVIGAVRETGARPIASVKTGRCAPGEWAFVALCWNADTAVVSLFVNGSCVGRNRAAAKRKCAPAPVALREGYAYGEGCVSVGGGKGEWCLKSLIVGEGCVKGFVDLAQLGCTVPEEFQVLGEFLVDDYGKAETLFGEVTWTLGGGVEMRGNGGVHIPKLDVAQGDFSVGCWVNVAEAFGEGDVVNLVRDWGERERSFRLGLKGVVGDGVIVYGAVCLDDGEVFEVEGGGFGVGEWVLVAMAWEAILGEVTLFVNGMKAAMGKVSQGDGCFRRIWESDTDLLEVGSEGEGTEGFCGKMKNLTVVRGAVGLF